MLADVVVDFASDGLDFPRVELGGAAALLEGGLPLQQVVQVVMDGFAAGDHRIKGFVTFLQHAQAAKSDMAGDHAAKKRRA